MSAREHPRAKLTETEVVAILALAATGMRTALIAEKFCVGKSTVADILSGRSWKNIHRPPIPARKVGRPRLKCETCAVDGCDSPVDARGWCSAHWARWKAHGDPLAGRTPRGDPLRFLEEALADGTEDCILWPYAKTKRGYACVMQDGRQLLASRVVCERAHGVPPTPSHEAAHSCGNGHMGCINPKHLRWATSIENTRDKHLHGTILRGEDHPRSKLTWAQVIEIRSLAGRNTYSEIAKRFDVGPGTIGDIIRGKIWKNDPALRRSLTGEET